MLQIDSSGGSEDYSAPFDDYGLVVPQKNSIYLLKLDNQSLTLSFDDYIMNKKIGSRMSLAMCSFFANTFAAWISCLLCYIHV